METPTEIRSRFLNEFVRQIVLNHPLAQTTSEITVREEPEIIKLTPFIDETTQAPQTISSGATRQIIETEDYTTARPGMIRAIKEIDMPAPTPLQITPRSAQVQTTPTQFDLWMRDPLIDGIECQGPDKPVILKTKGSFSQSTPFAKEEIQKIIEKLAREANTMIKDGVVKAETPQWSVVGILSEFGGSRFLLQKKSKSTLNVRA